MDNELMRLARGEDVPDYKDRRLGRKAKRIYDDTRLVGLEIDAIAALTGHAAGVVVDLDDECTQLAGGDPLRLALVREVEAAGLAAIRKAHRQSFGRFGL